MVEHSKKNVDENILILMMKNNEPCGNSLSASLNKPLLWAFQQRKHAFVLKFLPSTITLQVASINVLLGKHFLPPLAYIFIS